MLRILASRLLRCPLLTTSVKQNTALTSLAASRDFNSLEKYSQPAIASVGHNTLLNNYYVINIANQIGKSRTVIKFSMKKGTRMTENIVLKKFFRLHWGGWIRTRCGRQKKLWKKSDNLKRRLKQHVLCNSTQSTLLDKLVTNYWKRPKYYVEDPYTPYHTREEFWITRKKPVNRP